MVSELAVVGEVMLLGESVLTIVHPAGTWDASRVEQSRAEGHSKTPVDEAFVSQSGLLAQLIKGTFTLLSFEHP